MTIARVPSTYTQPLTLTEPLVPVKNQDNLYTLPDSWYIREDVAVGRHSIDHVLVSPVGIFALFAQHRSGVLQETASGFTVQGDRQDHVVQHAWHAVQALEHHLGSKVHPVLVYAALHAPAGHARPSVSRRGYTSEASQTPETTHLKVQGTLVTSWEHVADVLQTHQHRVLQWRDIMHSLSRLRTLR